MLIFADRGPRSVDDASIVACYPGHEMGMYVQVIVALANGEEISGLAIPEALARLQERLGFPSEAA
jgi:hypothetical protein